MRISVANPAIIRVAGNVYACAYGRVNMTTGFSQLMVETHTILSGGTPITNIATGRVLPGVVSQYPFADCFLRASSPAPGIGRYLLIQYGINNDARLGATVIDITDDGLTIDDGGFFLTPVSQVIVANGQESVASLIPLGSLGHFAFLYHYQNIGHLCTLHMDGAGTVTVVNDVAVLGFLNQVANDSICHVAGTVYAVAYSVSGQGTIKTINISDVGMIGAVINAATYGPGISVGDSKILRQASGLYLVAFAGNVHPRVATFNISDDGTTVTPLRNTLLFEGEATATPDFCTFPFLLQWQKTAYNIYLLSYRHDAGSKGAMTTFSVTASGAVVPIDNREFEATSFGASSMVNVGDGTNKIAMAYSGFSTIVGDLGKYITFPVLAGGPMKNPAVDMAAAQLI